MEKALKSLASAVGKILSVKGYQLAVAESCTGGLLSHTLTGIPGSSQYFIGGVIAYSNRIKETMLGVQVETLIKHGAVSCQTAMEMADGIRERFMTDFGLSTTGIAGPTGGTPAKPVGLVWIGISTLETTQAFECHFKGERDQIKQQSVSEILTRFLIILENIT